MPSQLFLPSDLLHSRDFLSTLRASSAANADGRSCNVIIVHKDSTSLYKATRKARRTAERVWTACAARNGYVEESCTVVCKCYFVGKDQAFSPPDGPKECDTVHKRLSSEFGTGSSVWIDGQNVAVREYKSNEGEGSGTREEKLNVVFFDLDAVGGLCAPNASAAKLQYDLMQGVLSSIFPQTTDGRATLIVHVRSEALHHCIASAGTKQGSRCIGAFGLEEHLMVTPDGSEDGESGASPIRRLRRKKGAANCPLTIYPARYVELPASGGDGDEATRRVEICRFHNYDDRGCLRSQKAAHNPEVKGCDMDHDHCHRCGGGHRALECQVQVDGGQLSSVAFRKTPSGGIASVVPILEDAAIHKPTLDAMSLPALLVLGGRLRGRTLATCEMLPLASSKNDQCKWEALPNLSEHRGSHAACAPPGSGVAFVLGGGTADGNSDTTEMLDFGSPGGVEDVAGKLSSPRHAFEAVTCVASEHTGEEAVKTASLFAVGGWMYGSKSCESVERLTFEYPPDNRKRADGMQTLQKNGLWELCAPLLLPRRLHSVVASSDGSSIYVFGGYIDERRTTSAIERYDNETNRWAAVEELPFGEHNCPLVQAVADGESFMIFPFSTQDGETPLVQRFVPGSDEPFSPVIVPGTGEQLRLPIPNWHSFSATSSSSLSKAFLVGGTIGGKWLARSFELDLLKMEWNELPPMTFARRRLATVVLE
ncbi:hypothetical protein ACHAXT_011706 [Thalassiosira profunda]